MCNGDKICRREVPDEALYIQCAIYTSYRVAMEQAWTYYNCAEDESALPLTQHGTPLAGPTSLWSKRSADYLGPARIRNEAVLVALASLI